MSGTLEIKDKFAVLVISCDKYSDLWEPFFNLFFRFWPDCPFNVYLLSNKHKIELPKVKNLLVGDDISWADNLTKAVRQLNEDYIFLLLDDFFLYDYVETDKIIKVFRWIIQSEANYVRMNPSQMPDKPHNELIGVVSKGTIYRTSTIMPVWKKEILLSLLKSGETAWDFEIFGSLRSDSYDGFYSTWEDCFPVVNGVIKGKWQKGVVNKLKLLDVKIDLDKRDVMTNTETAIFFLKQQRSKLLNLVPAKYRRGVKDFFLRGNYVYRKIE